MTSEVEKARVRRAAAVYREMSWEDWLAKHAVDADQVAAIERFIHADGLYPYEDRRHPQRVHRDHSDGNAEE